jgi:hypothetical protein
LKIPGDIRDLNFDLDITDDAEVIDRDSDMELRERFGSLLFKINTLGKFNMWKPMRSYNFKYGGLI